MQQRQELPPNIEHFLLTLEGDQTDQEREEPEETVHVYVEEDRITFVREMPETVESTSPSPPPPREKSPLVVCCILLFILACMLVLLLTPQASESVAFTVTVDGFHLSPVHQSLTVQAKATGKGYVAPTTATGVITFYNGQPYTQIIPVNTILKGADGIEVITNEQAVIPPAAQTIPPTYGQVNVYAHTLNPGASGNILAGDINQPCCVTSVIAQNPYAFSGGKDPQHFTSVTKQDVENAIAPLLITLEKHVPQLFRPSVVLSPNCVPTIGATPGIGQRATTVQVTVTVSCSAVSYHLKDMLKVIHAYSSHLGQGTLTSIASQVIAIDTHKRITLYVTATWKPSVVLNRWFRKQ